jgi:hypothetical protein
MSSVLNASISGAQQTPTEASRALFAALTDHSWVQVAESIDSAEIIAFRDEHLDELVGWARFEGPDAKRPKHGGMSGYTINGGERSDLKKYASVKFPVFSDVGTLGDLAALTPIQFLAKWIEATQRRGGWESGGPDARRRILGEVIEGDSLAHVLYRFERSTDDSLQRRVPKEATDIQLMMFRRTGLVWRAFVNQDLVFEPSVMMPLAFPHGH